MPRPPRRRARRVASRCRSPPALAAAPFGPRLRPARAGVPPIGQRPGGSHERGGKRLSVAPAFLGLGSNLAHPRRQLARAVRAIARLPGVSIVAVSPNYASAPIGGDEPATRLRERGRAIATTLAPRALLAALQRIERRAAPPARRRNASQRAADARPRFATIRPPPHPAARPHRAASADARACVRAASVARHRAGGDDPGSRARAALSRHRARPAHRPHPHPRPVASAQADGPRQMPLRRRRRTDRRRQDEPRAAARRTSGGDALLERPEDNPFLARFYEDMARYALPDAAQLPVPARRPAARRRPARHVPPHDRRRFPARQGSAVRAART